MSPPVKKQIFVFWNLQKRHNIYKIDSVVSGTYAVIHLERNKILIRPSLS